jgi:hypothetical protein
VRPAAVCLEEERPLVAAPAVIGVVTPAVWGASGGRSVAALEVIAPARNGHRAHMTWTGRLLSEGRGGHEARR